MSDFLKISGRQFQLPAPTIGLKFALRPGNWVIAEHLLPNGSRKRWRLTWVESGGRFSFNLMGRVGYGEVIKGGVRSSQNANWGSDAELIAQFPAKVRKLLVKEGAQVNEGDGLILIEAMKMEFSVKAPFKGKVMRLCVKEGQQLLPGDRFVDLKPMETEGDK